MKGFRIIAALLILALLAGSAALAEDASTDLSAEALCQYGEEAVLAGDYEKAMAYFQQAAEQDDPEALWSLGTLYYYGYGVEQSYEEAQAYFRRAAELGVEDAVDSLKALVEAGHVSEAYLDGLE